MEPTITMSAESSPRADKRITEMDEKINNFTKYVKTVPADHRPQIQEKLLSAKLMREKLKVMTALANAQTILAEMNVLTAEKNYKTAIEQLEKVNRELVAESDGKKKRSAKKPDVKSHYVPAKKTATTTNKKYPQENSVLDKKNQMDKKGSKRKDESSNAQAKKKHKTNHTAQSSESNASTLLRTSTSPIVSKQPSPCVTQSVRTSSDWLEQVHQPAQMNHSHKNSFDLVHRTLDDDEITVILEDLPEAPSSHKTAINLSQALRQIINPKIGVKSHVKDLTRSPVSSKTQLLFEDEPIQSKKSPYKVKTEAQETDMLNTSTEILVNELYRDIMQAKASHETQEKSSSDETFCKVMLKRLLEQC